MFNTKEQTISGLELWQWRNQARQAAIAADIPVSEIDWLLQKITGIDHTALQLESFKNQAEILLSSEISDFSNLWERRLNERVPI